MSSLKRAGFGVILAAGIWALLEGIDLVTGGSYGAVGPVSGLINLIGSVWFGGVAIISGLVFVIVSWLIKNGRSSRSAAIVALVVGILVPTLTDASGIFAIIGSILVLSDKELPNNG